MPRVYTRKSTRGRKIDVLERAQQRVNDGLSMRAAAKEFNIDRMTLKRFIDKRTADPGASFGYANCKLMNMTMTAQMEQDLADHVKQLARMFHGLSKEKVDSAIELADVTKVISGDYVIAQFTTKKNQSPLLHSRNSGRS